MPEDINPLMLGVLKGEYGELLRCRFYRDPSDDRPLSIHSCDPVPDEKYTLISPVPWKTTFVLKNGKFQIAAQTPSAPKQQHDTSGIDAQSERRDQHLADRAKRIEGLTETTTHGQKIEGLNSIAHYLAEKDQREQER